MHFGLTMIVGIAIFLSQSNVRFYLPDLLHTLRDDSYPLLRTPYHLETDAKKISVVFRHISRMKKDTPTGRCRWDSIPLSSQRVDKDRLGGQPILRTNKSAECDESHMIKRIFNNFLTAYIKILQ